MARHCEGRSPKQSLVACHCEGAERPKQSLQAVILSGEAAKNLANRDCFASLAMTTGVGVIARGEAPKQSRQAVILSGEAAKNLANRDAPRAMT